MKNRLTKMLAIAFAGCLLFTNYPTTIQAEQATTPTDLLPVEEEQIIPDDAESAEVEKTVDTVDEETDTENENEFEDVLSSAETDFSDEGHSDETADDEKNTQVTTKTETVTDGINVRKNNNGFSEIIYIADKDAKFTVLEVTDEWIKVKVDGVIGYVYFEDIETVSEEKRPKSEEMRVVIFSSLRSVVTPGENIVLSSRIYGFDGYEIKYEWLCDKGDGFHVVEGANETTYTFQASSETLQYRWRLNVYYR